MKSMSAVRLALLAIALIVAVATTATAQDYPWADSIKSQSKALKGEHNLQYYLDSLGYDINVATDELGSEVFCGLPGLNVATMVIEIAGSSVYATSGYYRAGDTSTFYQMFGPTDGPGDSVTFTFSVIDSVGFYMKPNLPGNNYRWMTENDLNSDDYDHAWVFATGVPHEFLICFEDLPDGGDADYQDLVIRVKFANQAPMITFSSPDTTIIACDLGEICFNVNVEDPNCQSDSISLTMLSGEGTFTDVAGVSTISAQHCFTPTSTGIYEFVFSAEDFLGATTVDTLIFEIELGAAPTVSVPDTSVFLCDPADICLPVQILDPDCDVVSVTTNVGSYSGTLAGFDQVDRINQLGGTITQVGGGAPGTVLTTAADYVAPINSQSGVSVTLPNFMFADVLVDAGSFPTGTEPGNSASHLLYAPTDLTFTLPGAGGPDGGSGDGSIAFVSGNRCVVGFSEDITTCNGANVDLVVFTNTNGGGTAELRFRKDGATVHTLTRTLPGGAAASGLGGVTFDLPDGLVYNEVRIRCTSGSLEVDAFAARTAPSTTTEDVCFSATESGLYDVIVTATDGCGHVTADTGTVSVTMNSAPVANAGSNQNYFVCSLGQICLPVSFSDIDNNLTVTEKVSGPGTLSNGIICFTPTSAGVFNFVIRAEDECGLQDFDTVAVTVSANARPVASDPSPTSVFQCVAAELCHTFTATDPNGGPLTWSHLGGAGAITPNGQFCFTPVASGTYSAAVVVADSCGAADTASITYNVTVNTAPVANNPAGPIDVSLCAPAQQCYQFSATDAQGGTLVWSLLDGPGAVSATGQWCFTPTVSGTYVGTVAVTDSCGLADTTSKTFNVIVNEPPTIAFGADSSLTLCTPQAICLSYTVSDPQGTTGLIEEMVSGYGTLDTLNNKVCFTPTASGSYEFVVKVKDNCNASDLDTVVVNVTFGEFASITCPTGTINVNLCAVETVCQALTIAPASAIVTVSHGSYSDGELCFLADTTGVYTITVIAQALCSADTCNLVFNVEIGEAAEIDCPAPLELFLCQAGTVCVPVGIGGAGASVAVSPIGAYASGNLCFLADTAGHYEIQLIAATDCGTDTCVVEADIAINSAPVAVNPSTPVDTFVCQAGQICYQFAASDVNGGALTWSRLSGNGTVSPTGQWCFQANATGTYAVTVVVTDSCGAADTTAFTYNVEVNETPTLAFPADTSVFQCGGQQICVPFALADGNDNITSIDLLQGTAYIFTEPTLLCFTPSNPGLYTFVLQATDVCGAQATDTVVVTVTFNQPPVVDAGHDLTRFQCAPAEICWLVTASDPDGNLSTVELVDGPGVLSGGNICFTPTGTLDYEFVVKATDVCGAEDWDTVVVHYTLNTPPVADAGIDATHFLCAPTELCWPASCSDVNGNLSGCALVEGPGTYDGTSICFTPTASGVYTFVLQATDVCSETDLDTVVVTVTLNTAPICQVPNDTVIFQCAAAEICLPVSATDADGNLSHCQIVAGQGTLSGGYWCYTPTASQTVTVTVRCTDECGAFCESQFTVQFEINEAPSIAFGADFSVFQCVPQDICVPYTVSDENDPRARTITLLEGPGVLYEESSEICFIPFGGGGDDKGLTEEYIFVIRVEDECGEFDQDTIVVTATLNEPPTVSVGADQTLFLCDADTTICWPASCSDPDGNLTDCLFNGPGSYDGTNICFTPATSGSYIFTLRAIDECLEEAIDTVVINVTLNATPVLAFGADTSLHLCTPQQACVEYTLSDADGLTGVVETMVSGYGSLDAANNRVCFTPTTAGSYEIVVRATDPCGAFDEDTIVIDVTFGEFAVVDCPTGPLEVSLCQAETVCQGITVTPLDATVTVSYGSYNDGELCFLADTSGIYIIEVIAEADCGADTCQFQFNVDIGSAAQIDCPDPMERFLCNPGNVCFPIGVMGTDITVTVSPIGSYTRGNVCFPADTSGHYEITVIAETPCGSDTCVAEIDVTINSAPVAVDPPVVDTFLCAGAQICRQFEASDINGGTLTWNRVSGNGSVSGDGLWCFDAYTSGTYTVTANVTDPCGAIDQIVAVYNVVINTAPVVTLPNDTLIFMCVPEAICFEFGLTDVDDNITDSVVVDISGSGDDFVFDKGTFCFTPSEEGVYVFEVTATDACGAEDVDTVRFAIVFNSAPTVTLPADYTTFMCNPGQITFAAVCDDPDDNIVSCVETTGQATFSGGLFRFNATVSGVYTFIVRATDACAAFGEDTLTIGVTINSAPVCQLPSNQTFFQCAPTQVGLPVSATDVDDNFDHCELISGPGSIVAGQWVYTPTADQTVNVTIMCLDDCGASCTGSFTVIFNINAAPVANAGADQTFFQCGSGQVCWTAGCTDEDGNLDLCEVLAPAGASLSGNQICLPVAFGDGSDQMHRVIVQATDECGRTDVDTAMIRIDFNAPPTVDLPPDFVAYMESVGQLCFSAGISDADDNLNQVFVSPIGVYSAATGQICFTADSTGEYCFEVRATDLCGAETIDSVCIEVQVDECMHVQIEKVHGAIQGQHTLVDIYLNGSGHELGGFDFLLYYDPVGLTPMIAHAGDLMEACGWEYFTYRFGPEGNCGNACPSSLMRLVGIAESNNGAYHPGCFLNGMTGTLATIDFLVSNDRTLECQYLPVEFFWYDCGDNAFSSRDGDTLWVSRTVYTFEGSNITNVSYGFPGRYGVPDYCLAGAFEDKPVPIRCVDFTNGGVDVICADSIDARGDINLNGIANEVADAVMFTNYFIEGLSAFSYVEGSIAASDVNADGLPLTVADLVYLIRVVVGDTPPIPKALPDGEPTVDFARVGDILQIREATVQIGAIFVVLEGNARPTLAHDAEGMELRYSFDGTETRVLIYNMEGKTFLEKGAVMNINGANEIKKIEVGGYDGRVLATKTSSLPDRFELSQNYPNPFNPVTTIEYALPIAGEWDLTVYNVLGQTVESWSGESEPGYYEIEWDAGRYASGVYLYRLTAGGYSATRKMVLLK